MLILNLLSAKLISVYDHAKCNHQANENKKKSKSDQMLLLAKSALSLSYSERREKRGDRPNNKSRRPKGYPKCYICNQKSHWTTECPTNKINSKDNKGETQWSSSTTNLAVNHLQSLKEYEVDKILMVAYDLFSTTGILLNCSTTAHIFTNK